MLDIGWSEIAVIVVVALIVIGPKDLPKVLKTVGIWVRKARMLTRDFQNSVDEMIREADMEDVRRQATELRNINIGREVEKTIDPSGSLRDAFDPNITSRPRADGPPSDDDGEAESDRLAHGEVKASGQQTGDRHAPVSQLPAPVAEPQLPATSTDLKIPEPASVPAESPDKRALPS
ncbi:MAG TPA: Sec-independent protein translocase protein TatB [Skermanella sp.]|jgi:sec-independent protein translocase protein TatB|nr:Sec-independent protein translocase protein TatB [Skermanella sp.]